VQDHWVEMPEVNVAEEGVGVGLYAYALKSPECFSEGVLCLVYLVRLTSLQQAMLFSMTKAW